LETQGARPISSPSLRQGRLIGAHTRNQVPEMNSKPSRIWDVPCALLDAVLIFSFDDRELDNLCSSAGLKIPCQSPLRTVQLRSAVHRACHEKNSLARQIERTLNLRFADQVSDLHEVGAREYVQMWFYDQKVPTRDYAGALWAIATSAGAAAHDLVSHVDRYVMLEALKGMRERLETGGNRESLVY